MSKAWQQVPLSEILVKSDESVNVKPGKSYREITVRLWGKGVVQRREVDGAEISAVRRLVVRENQFILSRIDARNGAFGLVPNSLDGAVVSNDFPSFTLNSSRVNPSFLGWLSRTSNFVAICRAASEGTTNRVRLKEDRFLATEISLPPLSEQRRIVARIEELAAKIEEARGLRREAMEGAEAVLASAMKQTFDFSGSIHKVGDFATVLGGYAFSSGSHFENGSHQIIRIGNVRDGYLDLSRAPVHWDIIDERIKKFELKEGDILISMTGTRNKRDYGYVAIVPPGRKLLLNQRVGKLVLRGAMESRYFAHFLRSPFFRDRLFPRATGTANQANLGNKAIEDVPFDPPDSLEEQCHVIAYLDGLQEKVDSLKRLQAETADELDALLPSVLDKAFRGEL